LIFKIVVLSGPFSWTLLLLCSLACKDGRTLELTATVNVAPGMLSGYTKIVRFFPRYVVFNRLERPIRLWQDSSVVRPASEDRISSFIPREVPKESRKWRYPFEDKHIDDKVNQYESLFGRSATIDDRVELLYGNHSTKTQPIPEGTTAHRSAVYVTSVGPSGLVPFVLPDTRAERQLRIDFGGPWNMTASFAADFPGEHILTVSRATDLRMLNHVATRAAPKYKIILPPPDEAGLTAWDGELGVFFETEWGSKIDRKIVVKGTKRGKYAFSHTDIHMGDELLRIDGVSVLKMTFAEAIKIIKDRLTQIQAYREREQAESGPTKSVLRRLSIGVSNVRKKQLNNDDADRNDKKPGALTLTFRTQEERLRKLRMKAGKGPGSLSMMFYNNKSADGYQSPDCLSQSMHSFGNDDSVNVELKSLHNTMFVILRDEDKQNPIYRVQNRSMNHVLFYRQRHCESHPWNIVLPGESLPYCWEEPMRSKKLTVRVAVQRCQSLVHQQKSSFQGDNHGATSENSFSSNSPGRQKENATRSIRLRQLLAFQYVNNEEWAGFGPTVTVRLEEIGFRCFLPLPAQEHVNTERDFLNCEVDTDGRTRLLIVSDNTGSSEETVSMNRNLDVLKCQMEREHERLTALQSLSRLLSSPARTESGREICSQDAQMKEGMFHGDDGGVAVMEQLKLIIEDFPEDNTVSACHQIVVEVLEAVGLSSSDFIGSCNPYCEVILKGRSRSRTHFLQRRRNLRKTYFVDKSLDPKWRDQTFVFDVPEDAVRVTRGHSIHVKVRNFRLVGQHPILGQGTVHFASLRNQQELVGWYPLSSKAGRSDLANSEDQVMSDLSRGSIKLRVQWIYTLTALVDYYILLSQCRLDSIAAKNAGMAAQLEFAISSDERKRESLDQLTGGHITKLTKLQKKAEKRAAKRDGKRRDIHLVKTNMKKRGEKGLERIDSAGSVGVVKETLKATRDRYLYALHFQTAESKRNRSLSADSCHSTCPLGSSLRPSQLPKNIEQKSLSSKQNVRQASEEKEQCRRSHSPLLSTESEGTSLDDFFAKQKSPVSRSLTPLRIQTTKIMTPSRATRRSLMESELGRRVQTYRKLSADVNDTSPDLRQESDPWTPTLLQGQALYDGIVGHLPDLAISDLLSESTDLGEEAKRRQHVRKMVSEGYVFHTVGTGLLHQRHLSNHFRRSLFASTIENRKTLKLYRPKLFVGRSSSITLFKSWQAAQALFGHPELTVVATGESFLVGVKAKEAKAPRDPPFMNPSKRVLSETLDVPDTAPSNTKERSKYRIETMHLFRTEFERACRRILGSTLNPGGWLTVRPHAALNLPDTYSGMFVKLSYGSQVRTSETVDARVSPRWIPQNFGNTEAEDKNRRISSPKDKKQDGPTLLTTGFKFSESDLHVHVEPQQTSGSIRISVVAERMNSKAELGVIFIPLGAAIAACIDSAQEMLLSDSGIQNIPAYTRWFPLIDPRVVQPVEGDMGLSTRPLEFEQQRDNTFQQYFSPCIQLSLIWWPDVQTEDKRKVADEDITFVFERRSSVETARVLRTPAIQNYVNVDLHSASVALLDSQRAVELLNLSFMEIDVRYAVTRTITRYSVVIGWIQVDHQDCRSREPVVLAPTPLEHIQPTLQLLALKDNLRSKSNIVSFEYVGVALREMDFTVEESWIFELWDFLMAVTRRRKAKNQTIKGQRRDVAVARNENIFSAVEEVEESNPTLFSILQAAGDRSEASEKRKVYVEHLILGLMKVNLSYVKGKKQHFDLNDQRARALKTEMKDIQNLALAAAGGIQFRSIIKSEQSEVFTKWSQMTFEDDSMSETIGRFCPFMTIISYLCF
jgi:hypothetical protein